MSSCATYSTLRMAPTHPRRHRPPPLRHPVRYETCQQPHRHAHHVDPDAARSDWLSWNWPTLPDRPLYAPIPVEPSQRCAGGQPNFMARISFSHEICRRIRGDGEGARWTACRGRVGSQRCGGAALERAGTRRLVITTTGQAARAYRLVRDEDYYFAEATTCGKDPVVRRMKGGG